LVASRLPRLLLQARGLCDSEALKLTLEFLAQTIDVRRSAARSWRMRSASSLVSQGHGHIDIDGLQKHVVRVLPGNANGC